MIELVHGDCLEVFGAEPDASFDGFVSDPPAGIGFMGRGWDGDHGHRDRWIAFWRARFEVMRQKSKAGAYALTWALPRTAHWTATALEDAGWQLQDVIVHVFGQGWPKARTALKPASEHWILARNGGGGALQIDACRVPRGGEPITAHSRSAGRLFSRDFAETYGGHRSEPKPGGSWPTNFVLSHCPNCEEQGTRRVKGNVLNSVCGKSTRIYGARAGALSTGYSEDGTETVPAFDCLAACDCGLSTLASAGGHAPRCACGAAMWWACPVAELDAQRGAASRFFRRFAYQAKASGGERDAGCEDLYWRANGNNPFGYDRVSARKWAHLEWGSAARGNVHPTVKRLALMEWLCALVAVPGQRLGDLTLGSGGTAIAWHRVCSRAGLEASFLGAELSPEALEIARARLTWWQRAGLEAKPRRISAA